MNINLNVERDIQVRELYTIGERGDLLKYSQNTYRDTKCHIKLENKLEQADCGTQRK